MGIWVIIDPHPTLTSQLPNRDEQLISMEDIPWIFCAFNIFLRALLKEIQGRLYDYSRTVSALELHGLKRS